MSNTLEAPPSAEERHPSAPRFQIHLSRPRLIALAMVLLGPWVAVALLWGRETAGPSSPKAAFPASSPHSSARVTRGTPGPWGDLEYTRITLELPDEFVFIPPQGYPPVRWFFKGFTKDRVVAFLGSAGLSAAQMRLISSATWNAKPEGVEVMPGDELILGLSRESRWKIYSLLIEFPENVQQIAPVVYRPERLDEWLEHSQLQPASIDLFKGLLYQGPSPLLMFADFDPALRRLPSEPERRRFMKTVARKSSLLARLRITPQTDVAALAQYWGIGGRRKDLGPLLESLRRIDGGCTVDIIHLLPRFFREHLYTYPDSISASSGKMQDCFWTAFNFFRDTPDDGFKDMPYVSKALDAEYNRIVQPGQPGDVIFLATPNNVVIHAAVYIADDIVFTKNGEHYTQPWVLMHLNDMIDVYAVKHPTSGPLQTLVYRKKSL